MATKTINRKKKRWKSLWRWKRWKSLWRWKRWKSRIFFNLALEGVTKKNEATVISPKLKCYSKKNDMEIGDIYEGLM